MSIYITTVIDGPAAVVMGRLEIPHKDIKLDYSKRVYYPTDEKISAAEQSVRNVLEVLEKEHQEEVKIKRATLEQVKEVNKNGMHRLDETLRNLTDR